MAKRRKRRKWSEDEKIGAQTCLPGLSVAQVARRYDVNANQVFNWLRDPRFAPEPEDAEPDFFLPVDVVEPLGAETSCDAAHGDMVVDLAGGLRLRITGSYDPNALAALIRKLST